MKNKFLKVAVVVGTLTFAGSALADTATASLDVTAIVPAACSVSTTPVNFGTVDPFLTSDVVASGMISVKCTTGTTYDIGLGGGASNDPANGREMTGNINNFYLPYKLYQDAAYVTEWGDTVGVDTLAAAGDGTVTDHQVYGIILGGDRNVPADYYSDTVAVTVTFDPLPPPAGPAVP